MENPESMRHGVLIKRSFHVELFVRNKSSVPLSVAVFDYEILDYYQSVYNSVASLAKILCKYSIASKAVVAILRSRGPDIAHVLEVIRFVPQNKKSQGLL